MSAPKGPKKSEKTDDEKFKKVVQHFLNTPPKPHKPTGGKKARGRPKKDDQK